MSAYRQKADENHRATELPFLAISGHKGESQKSEIFQYQLYEKYPWKRLL